MMNIPVDKLIRSRRRTIALVVDPHGSLIVRAPLRLAEAEIQKFIAAHQDWILKNQAKVRQNPPPARKRYGDGELFLFLGESHPLQIVAGKSPALALGRTGFHLAKSSLPKAEELFTRWYKKQARVVIEEKVETLARQLGYSYQKIRISSARTRWGSCSSLGTLSFTWRLVMAPPQIVDYVVIHELVHTKIKNHSRVFWEQVGKILPDYKKHVRWLKQNGKYLSL